MNHLRKTIPPFLDPKMPIKRSIRPVKHPDDGVESFSLKNVGQQFSLCITSLLSQGGKQKKTTRRGKRHKHRVTQIRLSWKIWYQPIYPRLAASHLENRSLRRDAYKCSGMRPNPPKFSEFEIFELNRKKKPAAVSSRIHRNEWVHDLLRNHLTHERGGEECFRF
ncbi:hypothetical protein B4113_3668 [Geobacillus sp. B4113_201601]|nr:hypothetical protein B4113_3668 [Geobacillus sp. B4113_201601]